MNVVLWSSPISRGERRRAFGANPPPRRMTTNGAAQTRFRSVTDALEIRNASSFWWKTKAKRDFLESQTAVPPESSTKRSRRLRLNATERHHVAVCFALHARPRRGRALLWVREATHRPPAPSRSARVSTPTASTPRFAARCASLPERVDRASDGRADPFPARLGISGSLRDSKRGEDGDVDVLALSRAR